MTENRETSYSMVLLTIALEFGFCFCTAAFLISVYITTQNGSYMFWVVISSVSASAFLVAYREMISKL